MQRRGFLGSLLALFGWLVGSKASAAPVWRVVRSPYPLADPMYWKQQPDCDRCLVGLHRVYVITASKKDGDFLQTVFPYEAWNQATIEKIASERAHRLALLGYTIKRRDLGEEVADWSDPADALCYFHRGTF